SNGTQSADIVIGAVVTHYTHRLDGQKYCECLPDRVVKPRLANLVQIDRVGLTQDFEFLTRHRTRAAYGQSRSREGMTADEMLRQAELAPERAHFVLEELTQRLHQLHVHALGQAAHIVVRLDGNGRTAGEGDAFDDVGI